VAVRSIDSYKYIRSLDPESNFDVVPYQVIYHARLTKYDTASRIIARSRLDPHRLTAAADSRSTALAFVSRAILDDQLAALGRVWHDGHVTYRIDTCIKFLVSFRVKRVKRKDWMMPRLRLIVKHMLGE
jgi:hypothetical protein